MIRSDSIPFWVSACTIVWVYLCFIYYFVGVIHCDFVLVDSSMQMMFCCVVFVLTLPGFEYLVFLLQDFFAVWASAFAFVFFYAFVFSFS